MSDVTVASSVPLLNEFDPYKVPYQIKVLSLMRQEYNYNLGPLEILLSGSVGSAKSLLLAHAISTHVRFNPGAGVLLGRRTLKDLKNTIWNLMLRHDPFLRNYWNKSDMTIRLPNKSIIYGMSWDDGNYDKFRSYELSFAGIEEGTENQEQDFYNEIRLRIGRAQGVRENVMITCTNPDSPDHWMYDYFINQQGESRKVFFSKTDDNPFLPAWYKNSLRKTLDPKLALRMLEGQWIEINQDRVYYNFEDDRNYVPSPYIFNYSLPLDIMFDFNNSKAGKPMSVAVGQYHGGRYHIARSWILKGMRTLDMMDELADSGLLDKPFPRFRFFGDATGRHGDTRSNKSDWDLIENFIANYKPKVDHRSRCEYEIEVPRSNPAIKARHNLVNNLCLNASSTGIRTRLLVYEDAKDVAKGFKLTKLVEGANLKEDDNLREQHITTACGYYFWRNEQITQDIAPVVIR